MSPYLWKAASSEEQNRGGGDCSRSGDELEGLNGNEDTTNKTQPTGSVLELAVGQRIRRGSIGVWHYVCPRLGGIGFSSCIVSWGPVAGTGWEAAGLLSGTGLTAQSPGRGGGHRLPSPWDSPGNNTGVGCHFLLQCMEVKVKVKSLSRVQLIVTPWTTAYQAPLSVGFSRQDY